MNVTMGNALKRICRTIPPRSWAGIDPGKNMMVRAK